MGWGSVLGTIGGIAATALTGGAAAPLIPILSGAGQAFDAARAEKKGAQQLQQGSQQAINTYQPWNQLGFGAANELAGELGVPQVPMGAMQQGGTLAQLNTPSLHAGNWGIGVGKTLKTNAPSDASGNWGIGGPLAQGGTMADIAATLPQPRRHESKSSRSSYLAEKES